MLNQAKGLLPRLCTGALSPLCSVPLHRGTYQRDGRAVGGRQQRLCALCGPSAPRQSNHSRCCASIPCPQATKGHAIAATGERLADCDAIELEQTHTKGSGYHGLTPGTGHFPGVQVRAGRPEPMEPAPQLVHHTGTGASASSCSTSPPLPTPCCNCEHQQQTVFIRMAIRITVATTAAAGSKETCPRTPVGRTGSSLRCLALEYDTL